MSNVVWQNFEKGNYGITRGGLSGQYGDMPPEFHLQKLEQTCMYEREDQLDDFFRSTLKDRTLDRPSLAQDMPKTKNAQDQVRSEVLNVRHSAARTDAEPIHPDLFLGFTERDNRGYHNAGPDFKLYADQSKSRGQFKDFVSDHASDWTIPEGTRSESRVIQDLRKTINPTKQRFKIFDTSTDGRTNPWSGARSTHVSVVPKTTPDGQVLNLNDAQETHQRRDNTKLKSDIVKVGYRQTGDHKFSIAQYGLVRRADQKRNIHDSQYKNKTSHKFDVHPSELKNRLMVNILQEVDRRKHLPSYRDDMKHVFKDSNDSKNKIKKLLADISTAQTSTEQTAETIDLGYTNNNNKRVKVYDPISHDTVVVDQDIFNKVSVAKNIKFAKKTDPLSNRNIHTEEGRRKVDADEMQTVVYKSRQTKNGGVLPTKTEHRWQDTDPNLVYKNSYNQFKGYDTSHTKQEQGVNPSADVEFNSYKKGMGYTQAARRHIDSDVFNHDSVNDSSGFFHSSKKMVRGIS